MLTKEDIYTDSEIMMEDLPSGIYLFTILTGIGTRYSGKVIKL